MKATEAYDVAHTTGTMARHVLGLVRGAHLAVSDTVHDGVRVLVGPAAATPFKVFQDVLTKGVYAATAATVQGAAVAAGYVATQRLVGQDEHRRSIHDGPAAHRSIALLNGLHGDRFAGEFSALAPPMHWRTPEGERFTGVPPDATSEIVVFVHGLFETEAAWRFVRDPSDPYAVRLRHDLGLTPVMVRYNTGLRISDNGRALSALLEDLLAGWPVPPTRLVLIGHSMGGLVLHSALLQAADRPEQDDLLWPTLVTDTISLGTPHHGSPVARGVHRASAFFGRRERGEWLADFLRLRSVGIRDLAHGNVLPADWLGHDPEDLTDHRTHPAAGADVPRRGQVRHHAVVGVVTDRLPRRVTEGLGDLVVPAASARHAVPASVRRSPAEPASTQTPTQASTSPATRFEEERVAVVVGTHHLGLLKDDRVYDHCRRWLVRGEEGP